MMKMLLPGAAVMLLFWASCKQADVVSPDFLGLLANGTWQIIANKTYTPTGTGTDTTDNYAAAAPCEKDNLFSFRRDGHIILDEGATKCDASSPQQSEVGSWILRQDYGQLYINDGIFVNHYTLDWLDSNSLVIEIEGYDPLAGAYNRKVIAYSHHQ